MHDSLMNVFSLFWPLVRSGVNAGAVLIIYTSESLQVLLAPVTCSAYGRLLKGRNPRMHCRIAMSQSGGQSEFAPRVSQCGKKLDSQVPLFQAELPVSSFSFLGIKRIVGRNLNG